MDGVGRTDGRMRDARRETRDARVPFQPLPSQGTAKVHHLPLNSPFPCRVPDSRTRTRVPVSFFFPPQGLANVLYQKNTDQRSVGLRSGASVAHKLTISQSHHGTRSKIIYDPCRPLVHSMVSPSSEGTLFELVGQIPPHLATQQ